MSAFTENLIVSPLPDGKTWVLRKEFSYDVGQLGSGETISVPVGFTTDFASVPRLFWIFFPKWGKYGNAAVIHDYLYCVQLKKYPRKRVDEILLEAMLMALSVPTFTAKTIYYCVRLFGIFAWLSNKRQNALGISKFITPADTSIEIPDMTLKGYLPNNPAQVSTATPTINQDSPTYISS